MATQKISLVMRLTARKSRSFGGEFIDGLHVKLVVFTLSISSSKSISFLLIITDLELERLAHLVDFH